MTELQEMRIESALRELVSEMYSRCYGAYGIDDNGYCGELEREIQNLMKAITSK